MKYNTHFDRVLSPPEINSGEQVTEQAGYIPPKDQIEQMIDAGLRLNQYRAEMYDFPVGGEVDEDLPVDPTRDKNFDLADASQMMLDLQRKQRLVAVKAAVESPVAGAVDVSTVPVKLREEAPTLSVSKDDPPK